MRALGMTLACTFTRGGILAKYDQHKLCSEGSACFMQYTVQQSGDVGTSKSMKVLQDMEQAQAPGPGHPPPHLLSLIRRMLCNQHQSIPAPAEVLACLRSAKAYLGGKLNSHPGETRTCGHACLCL